MKTTILLVCIFAVGFIQAVPFYQPFKSSQPIFTLTEKTHNLGRSWIDCTRSTSPGKITSATVTPDPPQAGEPIKFDFTFTLSERVTAGRTNVTVKWETITIADVSANLCEEVTCPLDEGPHTFSLTWPKIPADAPSGKYVAHIIVTDQVRRELGCIGMAWSF